MQDFYQFASGKGRAIKLVGHAEARKQDVDWLRITNVRKIRNAGERQRECRIVAGRPGQEEFGRLKSRSHEASSALRRFIRRLRRVGSQFRNETIDIEGKKNRDGTVGDVRKNHFGGHIEFGKSLRR